MMKNGQTSFKILECEHGRILKYGDLRLETKGSRFESGC